MDTKKISPLFFVAGQISASDVGIAATQGIKTIISNRPDKETSDQPETQAIAQAAADLGIEFLHVPVISGLISDDNVRDFSAAFDAANGPILAYCRSGMRSTSLWALMQASSQDIGAILATAGDAGYDLTGLRQRLEQRAAGLRK